MIKKNPQIKDLIMPVWQSELNESAPSSMKFVNLSEIADKEGFDLDNLRLNIGGGDQRYSNCINMELEPHDDVEAEVYGDITKGLPFEDNSFSEVMLIHVIEHIERRFHMMVCDEIWRVLKPNSRLIMGFPDAIENMKRFIENKYGARWKFYHPTIFGRQSRNGDFHVSAMEQQDITDRLINSGFVDIKYKLNVINVTLTARKGEKLNAYL
jgi:predicted SAM-dependent methyltransferase